MPLKLATLLPTVALLLAPAASQAAILFESGTLGPTGLAQGTVAATNVTQNVFTGVRFQLSQPVVTTQVGGHFVDQANGSFFGAIVELDDQDDFPDSDDLSTPDVLGVTTLTFPVPSDEVFGNLTVSLEPGWYGLVFGSGLFGTSGDGAAPRNNPDIGNPQYIGFQPGSGWLDLSDLSDAILFVDHHFVVLGSTIPEPTAIGLVIFCVLLAVVRRDAVGQRCSRLPNGDGLKVPRC